VRVDVGESYRRILIIMRETTEELNKRNWNATPSSGISTYVLSHSESDSIPARLLMIVCSDKLGTSLPSVSLAYSLKHLVFGFLIISFLVNNQIDSYGYDLLRNL
jgi:hypothetical protein